MTPTEKQPFSLADFAPFLRTLIEAEDPSVVIGGMAVSAWAEVHLDPAEHLFFDLPIYSKDVDLRGHKITSLLLAEKMEKVGAKITGSVTATRKNAPHMGRVFAISLKWRGVTTSVEVLERLPGLDTGIADAPLGSALVTRDGFSLLDPCSLFICKLHAANTRPDGGASNDVKHLAILACVIPRFLAKLREIPVEGYDAKEDAGRLLRQVEACEAGRHSFRVPLPAEEIERLVQALRGHLAS